MQNQLELMHPDVKRKLIDTAELSTGNFALLGHREVPAVVDGLNEVMKFNE